MIDDDRLPMLYYIHCLEKHGFEVKYFEKPTEALSYVEDECPHIDGIILDIMLPPGKRYADKDTSQGLRTGSFVLEDLHKVDMCSKVPVIILTNVRNPKTLQEFKEDNLLQIAFKPEYPPKVLTKLLRTMLNLE